ncbi:MAG: hypothetical protein EP330_26495 [Deltaproteobacteria bacterium]|nr:MAG: hypothetical protein EP330_26495 [Deltaproteobacteria bacterium]
MTTRFWALSLLLVACATDGDDTPVVGADTGTAETGDPTATDSGSETDVPEDTGGTATTATLTGVIDRSTEPASGGVGDLYVVVMDENPMTGGGNAIGAVIVENVDFSGSGASVTYTISDIPPSSTELYVTAFLDDNGTASEEDPGPDQGDLVAMEGISFPTITLDAARTYELDLTLSLSMPF